MKKNKTIKLTEILMDVNPGWMFFNPAYRHIVGETEIYINAKKINGFSRVYPENRKTRFIDLIYAPSDIINVGLEPFTLVDMGGSKNVCVKETPEVINELIEKQEKS